jgi:probable rRNA maturation factor
MKLILSVQVAAARRGLPRKPAIARWACAALRGLRRRRVALGVRIVNETESAMLNRRYRGRHGPTNVLSFPFEAPKGARSDTLGDLVVCAPLVRREARAQRQAAEAHWAHLVVHGILHLRGYDHENAAAAAVMEAREARVLRSLGYPNPYAAPEHE